MADNQNYTHKLVRAKNRTKNKKNEHMPVLVLHVVVAHNVGDQAYPMKASTEERQQLGWLEERCRSV